MTSEVMDKAALSWKARQMSSTRNGADTQATRGRIVLITGCSSGFGLETALAFARADERVYATVRDPAKKRQVESRAAAEGLTLSIRELDVTGDRSVQQAVDGILEAEGRIDVLVNNAGVARVGPVELLPDALVRDMFETNFFGPLRTIRAVLPGMRAQRSGVIINISSVAGRLWGKPITWAYDASKHALSALSDGLALELRRLGVRVRVIEPGMFSTNMPANSIQIHEPGSPYAEIGAAVRSFFNQSVANAPGAKPVVDAVLDAAETADPWPVHTLVGDDAQALVAGYVSTSERAWITRITESLKLP